MEHAPKHNERPRELRRRVVLPARLRTGSNWSDTCILNVSSRGLMIQSSRPALPGSLVELHRGDHVIVAKVMWRNGMRLGLLSEDRVPVEDIMSLVGAKSLQLVAVGGTLVERRKKRRNDPDRARWQGRAMEFIALIAAVVMFASCVWGLAHQAFAMPLQLVQASLSN
jgi:hypothetical protein